MQLEETKGAQPGFTIQERAEEAEELLRKAILQDYAGSIALVSSFGADSIVLLDMAARIQPGISVLLNETGMLFPETLDYQKDVAAYLGLTNVRLIRPTLFDTKRKDAAGDLHLRDPDACCDLRKTQPLKRALQPYQAWITGRKRFQSSTRSAMPFVERDEELRIKLNPLANWSAKDLAAYITQRDLPRHPLVDKGFPSIGCAPCTTPVAKGEDQRAGRWRNSEKIECGVHRVNGRWVRGDGKEA